MTYWPQVRSSIMAFKMPKLTLKGQNDLCSLFYRFRLFMFLVLQITAFHVPCFTDSGFSCSLFYRFRVFVFLVLQIPAFHVPCFTDSAFSCSLFYRFRVFMFLVLQIPAFHAPCFLVPRSVPRFPFLVLQIAVINPKIKTLVACQGYNPL